MPTTDQAPTWTRTPPAWEGWWWLRHNGRNVRPVHVTRYDGGLYLADSVVGCWLGPDPIPGCEFSRQPLTPPPDITTPQLKESPPMSRIYLAARYSRREELCGYADQLRAAGHVVTSRWINGNHQVDDRGLSVEAHRSERERFAMEDFEDVCTANVIINFTEQPRSSNSRGGRHVELGIALGLGMRCIVVGPRENVFHCLPSVAVYETWESALAALTPPDDITTPQQEPQQ